MEVKNKASILYKLEFPSYSEVKEKIFKKVGIRPEMPAGLPKGDWTTQSLKVLKERHLRKDGDRNVIETPEQMFWRVAWEVASAESLWGKSRKDILDQSKLFYNRMISKKFLPNSPTLMNAGAGVNLQYSGCFVIPVEDSLVGIFDALKAQALINQSGGGTGFSFNRLRPRGSLVKSTSGTASGPVSFMRIFNTVTDEMKQGGRRRGANMGILRVDHPDILEFIHCKEGGELTNFNISVAITNRFMEALKIGGEYDLINPKSNKKTGSLSAQKVFDEIVKTAWVTGDPGLVFLDRINTGRSNPVPDLGPIEATNVCGEQPLYPYDSCNLGSIFLNYFVHKDTESGSGSIDWKELTETIQLSTRFLDDVIEVNPFTLPESRKIGLAIRRIGLGIAGWGDTLFKLGIPYDSEQALTLAERVMKLVAEISLETSRFLAKERGPFPLFSRSIYKKEKPRRNSTLTTIAPTGTTSIVAMSSSGIEPLFALAYRHLVRDEKINRELTFINPIFQNLAKKEDFWTKTLEEELLTKGTVRQILEVPQEIRGVFGTAHEIGLEWHIRMQAAFQKYTDNAVSKTVNLNKEARVEDVKKAYLLAWEAGCKGVTIFRDGCKDTQVLNLGVGKTSHANGQAVGQRPFKVSGATYKLVTPVGSAFITINEDGQGNPLEIFINVGKAGSDVAAMAEALGRTLSTSLRFASSLTPIEKARELAHQLSGIGGRRWVGFGHNKILSLPDAVSIALCLHYGFKINGNLTVGASLYEAESAVEAKPSQAFPGNHDPIADSVSYKVASKEELRVGDICPTCGASALVYEEGCSKCHSCGYSEC